MALNQNQTVHPVAFLHHLEANGNNKYANLSQSELDKEFHNSLVNLITPLATKYGVDLDKYVQLTMTGQASSDFKTQCDAKGLDVVNLLNEAGEAFLTNPTVLELLDSYRINRSNKMV